MINKILAIIKKDTIIRFSSKSEWLFFLILPVFFTFVMAGGTGAPADPRVALPVVDQADSPLSAELIARLEKSDAVRVELMTLADAEKAFKNLNAAAILIIPAQFTIENVQAGPVELELRQLPNNLNAMSCSQAVHAAAQSVASAVQIAELSAQSAEQIKPFESESARAVYISSALSMAQEEISRAPARINAVVGNTADEIEYDPSANTSAGQLITWVFIPLFGISAMFAYERTIGTLKRLLITPSERAIYLLGTLLGQVFWALVQMTILVLFGALVMKVNWGQSPAGLIVMLVSSALAAAAIGTALGTFVKTESQANSLSIMLGMVMALLGGCWYPLELFPAFVQQAVKALPTTWAMQGMLDINLRGQGLTAVLPEAGVLLGFAALFFTIGIVRFKYE